jgi:DNA topoisomerase-2
MLSTQYQMKTDKQHILENPDTYIGSVEMTNADMWIMEGDQIILKSIHYNPGLYKLFDEGIVNCRDHVIRMATLRPVTYITVHILDDGTIVFENDGDGIDVVKHPEHDIWIPEMIFGHLRTSSNYDKSVEKIVGGKNGFGFKLALIWSIHGTVETVDAWRKLSYKQEFRDNLTIIESPTITELPYKPKIKSFTKVSFLPDYERLGMTGLTEDMIGLFRKRLYDIAAVTELGEKKKVKITFHSPNNSPMNVSLRNFQDYVKMYIGAEKQIYETNTRWEYCISLSTTGQFEQISFVNGICTFRGGKHVDYVMNQLTRKIQTYIETKKKISVNTNTIKEQLHLFLRCDIVNPSFDSQTKDYLNTLSSKFGSTCSISDAFVEKVVKLGVMNTVLAISQIKEKKMASKTDGSKNKIVRGIQNFIDANFAGTSNSSECTLILCEGLSAMSGVMSGLQKSDKDVYGIYPLKGKLLNVRGENTKRICENKEISDLKKILGLESGKTYATWDSVHQMLRYSKIMILTDADNDGIHIRGLCLNLFDCEWPSLFKLSGFLSFMNTPILKASNATKSYSFYNQGEYINWRCRQNIPNISSYKLKYLKGLGSSTSAEFKEYFANNKIVDFEYVDDTSCDNMDKIFNKKRTEERKVWLRNYDEHRYLDTTMKEITYDDFIDSELIHFSIYDCQRNIPHLIDGLKTSQRKILWCCFRRNLVSDVKVAQLSGYISEHSHYLHGEKSLHTTIISMAQDFVGSNNINLLLPHGQFGTRLQGGSDSASERYIFTQLNSLCRIIYNVDDDERLDYVMDDGHSLEPIYYSPIIPMVLVNGISGIGTGFSTTILPYNPFQLIDCILDFLNQFEEGSNWYFDWNSDHGCPDDVKLLPFAPNVSLDPYYEGFTGTIVKQDEYKYIITGIYEKKDENSIRITELPIGTWTLPYIDVLNNLIEKKEIKNYTSNSTETEIDIVVYFYPGILSSMTDSAIIKVLKLSTIVSTNNMHLFDAKNDLRKYNDVYEIIGEYFMHRIVEYKYRLRNTHNKLSDKQSILQAKSAFITLIKTEKIKIVNKSNSELEEMFITHRVRKIDDSYDFYMKIPLSSLTYDKIDELDKQVQVLEAEIRKMDDLTPHDYWRNELSQLKQSLLDSKKIVEKKTTQKDTKNNVKKVPKKRVTKSTKVNTEDNTEKENENEEGAENESKKRKISILD